MSNQTEPTTLHDPEAKANPTNGFPLPGPLARSTDNKPGPRTLPSKSGNRGLRWYSFAIIGVVLLLGADVLAYFTLDRSVITQAVLGSPTGIREDVILHTVKREPLSVSVVEKGTIQSSDNREIICQVEAGRRGNTTIKWVIPDGTRLEPNTFMPVFKGTMMAPLQFLYDESKLDRLVMVLDESAINEEYTDQKIDTNTALAAKVKAELDYEIALVQNQAAIDLAQIELNKLTGLAPEPGLSGLGAAAGMMTTLREGGQFQQELDDLNGQISLARADVEQYQERAAWAERMVRQSYMSPAQAQSEQSRLASAVETLRSLIAQRDLLKDYDRQQRITDLTSKLRIAELTFDAQEAQFRTDKESTEEKYQLELAKLAEDKVQLQNCRIYAPEDIEPGSMVVYFKNESSRWRGTTEGLIEQGQMVKEGQKLLRIPNLKKMQVNTKVHEAMIANVEPGQRAMIQVDALPGTQFVGHVVWKAAVASQANWYSDTKQFETIVAIDGKLSPDGKTVIPLTGKSIRPDMNAVVTIHVDAVPEPVLTVPIQAIIGGAEKGETRDIFVHVGNTYERRSIKLGLANQRMVEVKEGIKEGDQVVVNPKVLLGETQEKTREPETRSGQNREGYPKEGAAKGGGGAKTNADGQGKAAGGKQPGAGGSGKQRPAGGTGKKPTGRPASVGDAGTDTNTTPDDKKPEAAANGGGGG